MGLLDQFSGMSEDQTQGLLAAAAQMMQQSGPSLRPTSLGQILGGGLSAYQDSSTAARKRKLEEDAVKQAAQLRGLQIQEAQGGLADHERARQQAELLRQFYTQQRLAQAPTMQPDAASAQSAPPPQMPSAMPGGPMSPKIGGPDWMQAYQAGQPPPAAAASLASAPQPQAQAGQGDPYSQRMLMAQQLRSAGFHAEADAQEAQALKFKPKFDNSPHVVMGPNGKPMLVQTADDGTVRPIAGGYGVAEKMAFHNLGGKTIGVDPYSGTTSATFNNTQSPDSIASNGVARDRLSFDKTQADQPKFNAEIGGFVSQPTKDEPRGAFLPLAGSPGKPLTESQGKAALFASRMDKSNQVLEQMMASGTKNSGGIKRFAEGAGNVIGLGTDSMGGALSNMAGAATNWTQSDQQQQVEQAKRDFLAADLRLESGAAIGKKEIENGDLQYFPQPGDSDAVLKQKAANRATAIQGMSLMSGPGATKLGIGAAAKGKWSITKKD